MNLFENLQLMKESYHKKIVDNIYTESYIDDQFNNDEYESEESEYSDMGIDIRTGRKWGVPVDFEGEDDEWDVDNNCPVKSFYEENTKQEKESDEFIENLHENNKINDERLDQEFYDFLKSKNAQYIADEIHETDNGLEFDINDGDWKHEHLYMKQLVKEFFNNKGVDVDIYSEVIGNSESDDYSAHYDVVILDKKLSESVNDKQIGKKRGLKHEASYGGAFDIQEDQYFTRDDLDEFANYVMEEVSKLSKYDWILDLVDIYFEDNSELEMTISYKDYEFSYTRGIDMRRIKTPQDLIKKYAAEYISYFYNEIEDEIENNQSEYIDYQGLDTRTGEDMDVNSDFWH